MSPECIREDARLVEPSFALSSTVKWNRHNRINGGVTEEVCRPPGHEATQMSPEGDPPTVLEQEKNLPEGIVALIEDGGAGQEILGGAGSTGLAQV